MKVIDCPSCGHRRRAYLDSSYRCPRCGRVGGLFRDVDPDTSTVQGALEAALLGATPMHAAEFLLGSLVDLPTADTTGSKRARGR